MTPMTCDWPECRCFPLCGNRPPSVQTFTTSNTSPMTAEHSPATPSEIAQAKEAEEMRAWEIEQRAIIAEMPWSKGGQFEDGWWENHFAGPPAPPIPEGFRAMCDYQAGYHAERDSEVPPMARTHAAPVKS